MINNFDCHLFHSIERVHQRHTMAKKGKKKTSTTTANNTNSPTKTSGIPNPFSKITKSNKTSGASQKPAQEKKTKPSTNPHNLSADPKSYTDALLTYHKYAQQV